MDGGDAKQNEAIGKLQQLHDQARSMSTFRQGGVYVDAYIICGETTLPAHRLVLACCSPLFDRILSEDSGTKAVSKLEIDSVSAEIMDILLEYMYLGQVDVDRALSLGTDLDLMTVAHFLQVEGAPVYFCQELLNDWCASGLSLVWDWVDFHDMPEVRQLLLHHLATHLDRVCKEPNFLDLPCCRLVQLFEYASQRLPFGVGTLHDRMLLAILSWARHRHDDREQLVPQLLEHVQLSYVSTNVLDSLKSSSYCSMLRYMKSGHSRQSSKSALSRSPFPSPCPSTQLLVPPTEGANRKSPCSFSRVIRLDRHPSSLQTANPPRSKTPVKLVAMSYKKQPVPFSETRLNFDETKVMVVSKTAEDRICLHCVQTSNGWWSMPHELPLVAKEMPAMIMHDNEIFLFGCTEDRNHSNSDDDDLRRRALSRSDETFVFDVKSMTVRKGLTPRWPRTHMATALAPNDRIFLVGGLNRMGKATDTVEIYDARLEQVEHTPRLIERRYEASCVVVNSRLFVFGGHTFRCEAYDYRQAGGLWTAIQPLPEMMADQAAPLVCVLEMKVYAFPREMVCKLLCYNPKRDAWRTVQVKTQVAQCNLIGCAVASGKIHLLDEKRNLHVFDLKQLKWDEVVSAISEVATPICLLATEG